KLWVLYNTQAGKDDQERAESWNGDTQGIIIFTGLFSATIASLLVNSYNNLIPSSGDNTVSALTHISEQLAAHFNGTPVSGQVPAFVMPPFHPPPSAVVVNTL
ncbi:hypothetical protein BC834DRAFT_810934, partial [Gloeopeniophorella convolvens]